MQPYFKVKKNDLDKFPELHERLAQLSETINESNDSYLYSPLPGKMRLFVEKFNATNITYQIISQSHLHIE